VKNLDFKKTVKHRLVDMGKTQKWLEDEIKSSTGLFVDSGYMHKILSGQRQAPKIVDAICEILNIKKEA
jgi:glutaredoxin